MGLMSFFKKAEPIVQKPNPTEYVEWLLTYMLQSSRTELKIDTRRPLPGSDLNSQSAHPPPCIPEAQTVINRLKILSGVNPVWKEGLSTGGSFERPRTHLAVTVATQFQDEVDGCVCVIKLKIRAIK
ncbi:MAG: hypothetical protein PHO37_12160 [Kiritimatiellae bacterium]|nr:hypothetical protein [Kiritimatiellia bacterium]